MADKKYRKIDNYKPLASEDPVSGDVFFDQVLDRFHIDLKDAKNQIIVNWRSIVGDSIADHVRCEKIEKGIMHVVCDHPTRAAYVKLNASEIIKSIKSIYPEVELKKIVARVRS